MSEVKKISPVGNIYGWEESQFGEFVLSQDYDDLAAEAQALREEVARAEQHRNDQADLIVSLRTEVAALRTKLAMAEDAAKGDAARHQCGGMEIEELRAELATLRARVVVLPSVDNVMNIVMRYQWNEKTNVTGTTNWAANLGMKVVEEVKRLNGKTVSEGLLRQLLDSDGIDGIFDAQQNYAAHQELRALLSEKEGGRQ
ncbi:TPA: hypothetical protein L3703_002251 [Pseudomonas aeruginosa]|uniref:hypothetical protein n=1 Tax=Pseudomonas aeruginosa TaxID=287 RepID=UPI0021AEF096|nr:hypothetical protein [Pseudomonas aeruginosa]MCT5424171.1 hypothetical protein [Pseudomonas aeruginosa]MEA8444399.1 hypothetical protein [Pseudomonas aeruginosa]HBN8444309.1 hypothetical protein [Pseudomonas aeruginosa]